MSSFLRGWQVFFLIFSIFLWQTVSYGMISEEPLQPNPPSRYAPGRILVKLTPAAAQLLEKAGEGQNLSPEQLPIEQLRKVSERYKVISWKPLLVRPVDKDPTGMNRIYVLTSDLGIDISAAVQAFRALSEFVEYAEPDYEVQIQAADPSLENQKGVVN